MKQFDKLRSN